MATAPDQDLPADTAVAPGLPAPDDKPSLTRFLGPRYWTTWLFIGWLKATAALPWRAAIALHTFIGRTLWHLLPSQRRIVLRNLELCFPKLTVAERAALGRRFFQNFGATIAEIAIAWFGTAPRSRPPVRTEGLEHLEAALAGGHGVILYSGHFTTLELTAQFINALTPSFAFMFRRRSNALLDAMQARGRERTASNSFNNADVRGMLRMLARNSAIWYAPDQAHSGRGSMLLPFFGEPAMTNTATVRLARLSGAAVVPLFAQRLPGAAGYLLRFEAALTDLPSGDVEADQRRLGDILERFVNECPEQYLWTHRKFKGRGPELPDLYKRSRATERVAAPLTLKQRLATPGLIVAVALFIATLQNGPLWRAAADATVLDEHRAAILWSLFAIVFCTLAFVLALVPGRRPLKLTAGLLLIVGAACNYFMVQYGIVIDESMVRNTVETTVLEATPFLGTAFVWHLTFYGLAPAALVSLIRLPRQRRSHALLGRLGVAFLSLAMLVASLYINFGVITFFGHQHRALRLLMNPGYPLYATVQYFAGDDEVPVRAPLSVRLATAVPERRPAIVVFVMGETARADRFSLNGYDRDTNRYTREHKVVNFPDVHSCGTSTAESVPCVFSHLGQAGFSHEAAAQSESWFSALGRLGVDIFWRDNSTGCKDVCDPEHFVELANETTAEYCDSTGCFDEILLEDFDALLTDRSRDHFVVLHQRGSHGPAYHTTVPQTHKEYLPECDLPSLRNCTREAINNAYDNTILYTDFFLSRLIETLEARSDDFDTAMVYVSDHGESLGENGLYLHGFPYALAPEEQKRVPMLFWASQDFYTDRLNATQDCVREAAQRPTSHDALMHTILPWFGVEAEVYDERLDLFAACRRPSASLTLTRGDATPLRTAAAAPGTG